MKTRLVGLSFVFTLVVLGIIYFALMESVPMIIASSLVLLGVAACGMIFWFRYIRYVSNTISNILHDKKGSQSLGFDQMDIIHESLQQIAQRFNVSASLISQLTNNDEQKEITEIPANDPIALALQNIKVELTNLKEEEGRRAWINIGLAKFGEILRKKSDLSDYSYQIISQLVRYVKANQGGFYIQEHDQDNVAYLELKACFAYNKRKYENKVIYEGQGLLGQCMLEKDMLFITDIPEDYITITSGLGEATPRNIVVVPLLFNGDFYGVIELAFFHIIKPHEVEFLKRVAVSIASEIASLKTIKQTQDLLNESEKLAIELKSHEEEMRQSMEELAATQEEMAHSQAELTGIINAIDVTLCTIEFDTKGKVLKFNSLIQNLFGYTASEFYDKDISVILGREVDKSLTRILDGALTEGDFKTESFTGKTIWLNATFTVVRNHQQSATKILCLAHDITAKKNKEREFERLSLVANTTDNAVIITDAKGFIEYVNEGFIKLTGYAAEEVLGKKPGRILQGKDTNKETVQIIRDKMARKQPVYEEILNYNKQGESYWISIAINPVMNAKGEVEKFISIQADITETKRLALDFQYKMQAFSRSNCILELDMDGRILDANASFLELTDYTLNEILNRHYRFLLPESELKSLQYQDFWERLGRGEYITNDFAIKSKSSGIVWIRGVYSPILDMNNRPVKIVQFAVDITEEKRLEHVAAIKQKELNSYLEGINNTVASAEFDASGLFRSGNEIFLKILGYAPEDLKGKRHTSLMGEDHTTVMMWENLKLGRFFSGEFKMKDKQGKEMILTGTFNPIMTEGRFPTKIIMFAQFITQEKEKLNDLNAMVQAIKYSLPVLELNDQLGGKMANDKFLKLLGISRMDVKSKMLLDFIDPNYHQLWNKAQDEILTKDFSSIELPFMIDGNTITYQVSVSVAKNLEGKMSRVILILLKQVETTMPVFASI
jgi:PAS domain S-box-containing protein